MIVAALEWGGADWLPVAAVAAGLMLVLVAWSYGRSPADGATRALAASLKALGVALLAACLLDPLLTGSRAQPGANLFVILADNSQSMTLRDRGARESRGDQLKGLLREDAAWTTRLSQDFDVRRYAFDSQLRPAPDYGALPLDGASSALGASLERIARRYQGRPLAGIVLLTDGNATDAAALEKISHLPPIYPVLVGGGEPAGDIALDRVEVTQTNFEDTPVTLTARISASGYRGRTLVAQLLDEADKVLDQQTVVGPDDEQPAAARFLVRPEKPGVSFYKVRAAAQDEVRQFDYPAVMSEATLANNTRLVSVDRGQGPYRILYVSGRPNWEFKTLRRALEEDDQVQLIGLLRVARREPKFDFRARGADPTNPLFRGFDLRAQEQVEQYDKPVLVRLGTQDEAELRSGFPLAAEDLFGYDAIILDDLEAEFFTQDQMLLLKDFVRQRGGALLMLGGQESFREGKFDHTPIGELLPVYLDDLPTTPPDEKYRLALSREGWLAPWVRLRPDEDAERRRLSAMPPFLSLNQVRGMKPGATVLATALAEDGRSVPALVEQHFGQGRAAALLIADLWRWGLRRAPDEPRDVEKAWRQAIRWLVSDVPQRVRVDVDASGASTAQSLDAPRTIAVEVRDSAYRALDNAAVVVRVTGPDSKALDLNAEPSDRKGGVYEASYMSRQPGAYHVQVTARAPDGSEVGQTTSGWTADPAADEYRELRPNRDLLKRLAERTGGEVISSDQLDQFAAALPFRTATVTEPYAMPFWHQSWVFLAAIACLTAEWGLRRWKGLP